MLRRVLLLLAICSALPAPALRAQGAQAPVIVHANHFLDPAVIDLAKVLPAPPEPGSLAAQADLEAVRMAQSFRSPELVAWALKIDADDPFGAADVLGDWFRADALPLCSQFLKAVDQDMRGVTSRAKSLYKRPRPFQVDPAIEPCVPRPTSFSYPSGHSTHAFNRALVLGEVFPERAAALLNWAHRAAWGRIQGGVHFPSDDVGGRLLAEAVVVEMKRSPAFRAAVEACRKEAEPFLKTGANPRP